MFLGDWAAPSGSLNQFCQRKHFCCGRPDRSLVLVGSLLRCLPLTPLSIYELSLSCSIFPSFLEKCVLFSIISFQHLQSSYQSVSHLQLPLFSLIPLHCAFVSHSLASPALFCFRIFCFSPSPSWHPPCNRRPSVPPHCDYVPVPTDLLLCV